MEDAGIMADQTEEECWLNAWATKSDSCGITLLTLIWLVKVLSDALIMVFILFQNCFGFLKAWASDSL